MSDKAYDWIVNVLIIVGIASAMAFDSGKVPHWVAGGIAIAAGIGALVLVYKYGNK